ncbi:ankyrin repeat domain-containing protein [bacterium]|nr:ankyrin repeat domain-containing protein [bacterium]
MEATGQWYPGRCGRQVYYPWADGCWAPMPPGKFDYSPEDEELVQACEKDDRAAVARLLESGLSPDTDFYLETPIHQAAKFGHVGLVSMLIERGAAVSPEARNGLTPLHLAACYGQVEAARLLIKTGADVNANGRGTFGPGFSPAYFAAKNGSVEVLELLLSAGALPDGPDGFGFPLSEAGFYNDIEMMELLYRFNANLNARDHEGRTVLAGLRAYGCQEAVNWLERRGARV